jgi:hypothetical protein
MALIVLSTATAAFGANYVVVPVQIPNGFTNVAMSGINNSGQVAGYGTIGSTTQAFIGSPSGSATIPLPSGWTNATVSAISASGQVVGTVSNSGPATQAFIGTLAGSTVLPLPTGRPAATGSALNDSGQVVQTAFNDTGAFIGTSAGSTLIPAPAAWAAAFENGAGMNNSAQVTGTLTFRTSQAFIGNIAGSATIPLPPVWAQANTFGFAVNDSGQVVGYGYIGPGAPSPSSVKQAFIGTPSAATAIPLPSAATYATIGPGSLNNSGAVVGQSDAGGWIWDATNGTRLLNSLVQPGWSVSKGISISNSGLILAQASYQGGASQYVELVSAGLPGTPAPSTLILVLIGAIFCAILFHASRGVPRPLT